MHEIFGKILLKKDLCDPIFLCAHFIICARAHNLEGTLILTIELITSLQRHFD